MKDKDRQALLLKAKIEFGPGYGYVIRTGGLGQTLVIDAGTRKRAGKIRKLAPSQWEGLYVIVIYNTAAEDEEDEVQKKEKLIVKKPETPES
jgi:hypothetical protein